MQEGCDKFCTFCVVPYTRGAEVSRPVAKIVAEVERLADAGVREVTLIGQNVNAYHGDGPDGRAVDARPAAASRSPRFPASRGCATPPAIRATWTTSLIAAHRDLPALMPYLHLPVQSGSDRILAAMNRRHTPRRLSARDRAAARRAAGHRVLVGFHRRLPGRDRATISAPRCAGGRGRLSPARTRSNIRRGPARRPPTMDGQVAEGREDRAPAAAAGRDRPRSRRRSTPRCVGRTFDVLFEKPGRHPGQIVGRSPYLQPVQVMAPAVADRRDGAGDDHRNRAPTACSATLAGRDSHSRARARPSLAAAGA